jgi:leader peptidase (prepilin peptidase)/N-methyltransferase
VLVALVQTIPQFRSLWLGWLKYHWVTGLLGSMLGAMVGGLVIWLARIFGTLMFARVAMGLGDVHLMFGVGAIIGPGPVVIAFFLAPFAGLLVGLYMLITRRRHELPYGPYLSLATLIVILVYCPIVEYLRPGLEGMGLMIRRMIGVN